MRFLLATAALGLIGCNSTPMPLEFGASREAINERTTTLWLEVKTEPNAEVRCEPFCGNMTADASGVHVAYLFLQEQAEPQTIRISVSRPGLLSFGGTSKDYTHTLKPGVGVYAHDKSSSKFRCALASCAGEIAWEKGPQLTLAAAAGTSVTLGGLRSEVPASGTLTAPIPTSDLFAAAEIEAARNDQDGYFSATARLALTLAPGQVLETTLTQDLAYGELYALLRGVADEPLLFPGEASDQKKRSALLVVHESGDPDLVGTAKTFADIDLIATRLKAERKIHCGTYVGGGETAKVETDVHDAQIDVYERRTGKRLGQRKFFGASGCPDTVQGIAGQGKVELWGGPNEELITAWLKTYLKS